MKQFKFLLAFLIVFLFFSPSFSSESEDKDKMINDMAPKFGPERLRKCKYGDYAKIDDNTTLDLNAHLNFASEPKKGLGSDFMFEMSNPYCSTYFTAYWFAFRVAIATATTKCGGTPSIFPNPLKDIVVQTKNIVSCAKTSNLTSPCCTANIPVLVAATKAAIQASVLYGISNEALKRVRVCGYNWSHPTYRDDKIEYANRENISYKEYLVKPQQSLHEYEKDELTNSGRRFKINNVIAGNNKTNAEYIKDNIDNEDCSDDTLTQMQPFYLRGLDSGNFNCGQYDGDKKKRRCCESLAKNYICLEDIKAGGSKENMTNRDFVFCKKGTTCRFNLPSIDSSSIIMAGIPFVEFIVKEREEGRILCAESHSLCPYNFSVAGGTTYPVKQSNTPDIEKANKKIKDAFLNPEADNDNQGEIIDNTLPEDLPCKGSETQNEATCQANPNAYQLKNQCQYYSHCTIASDAPYTIRDRKINRYFSYACLDFKGLGGDKSQSQKILGNEIYLGAPIAQCFYETFGNIFNNKNGHTLCISGETTDGTRCINSGISSNTIYEKGLSGGKNIFKTIQDNLRFTIRVALTLAVLFFGIKILISPGDVIGMSKRKEMILLVFKIGIVGYFALGNAWQTAFFDAIYNSFPELIAKFFTYTAADGDMCKLDGLTKIDYKSYLKVFGLLDCKLKYYLAFTPGTSTANVLGLIFSTLITGSYGFLIAISLFFFVIMMIIVIMRALYLFITSALAIVIYIFISPIIFPTLLFKQTENIFNKWLTQLVSFTLQPIILFVYIAIFIQASDLLILGKNPKFTDEGAKIDCAYNYVTDQERAKEDAKRFACLLQFNQFSRSSAFSIISVGLPSATMLFSDLLSGGKMGLIFVVLRGVVGIYLLLKMFDLIPGIIDYIFGSSLDKQGQDVLNTFKSFVKKASFANKIAGSLAWNQAFNTAEQLQGKKDEKKDEEGSDKKDGGSGVV